MGRVNYGHKLLVPNEEGIQVGELYRSSFQEASLETISCMILASWIALVFERNGRRSTSFLSICFHLDQVEDTFFRPMDLEKDQLIK